MTTTPSRCLAVALLLLPVACATPEHKLKPSTTVLPLFEPMVEPVPVVRPVPVVQPPPVPVIVVPPEGNAARTSPDTEAPLDAARPGLRPRNAPEKAATAEPGPKPKPQEPSTPGRSPPAPPVLLKEDPRCRIQLVKHLGGYTKHNDCADKFPPNRYPGFDVFVNGKHFDALSRDEDGDVLWEIKTDRFDTYSLFIRDRVINRQVEDLKEEKKLAEACGFKFAVGVSGVKHREALQERLRGFTIIVTGC